MSGFQACLYLNNIKNSLQHLKTTDWKRKEQIIYIERIKSQIIALRVIFYTTLLLNVRSLLLH